MNKVNKLFLFYLVPGKECYKQIELCYEFIGKLECNLYISWNVINKTLNRIFSDDGNDLRICQKGIS